MPEFDPLNAFCLVFLDTLVVVGVMGNSFIVLANGLDWVRSKTMSPSDVILTTLSLSRLIYLGLLLYIHRLFFLDVNNPKNVPEPVIFLLGFVNAITLWVSTCLSAFYCMKLVSFSQAFFVKMKLRISWLIPRLLLGSVPVSLITSLPIICLENCSNTSIPRGYSNLNCPNKRLSGIIYIVAISPSFIIVFVSSVILIRSLLHHAQKMQQKTSGVKGYRMDVLITAVKTVFSFVIFFSASFVAVVSLAAFTSPWTIVMSMTMITLYNSGHAVILIATNPKLKRPLIGSLQSAIGCVLRGKISFCPKTAVRNGSS